MNKHVCETHRAEIEETVGDGSNLGRSLREHLAACAPCKEFLRERAALRVLVGGLGKVDAPADFEFRLRARMASAGGRRRIWRFDFGFVPSIASVALAVCFVSVSAWVYLKREPAPNQSAAPTSASAVVPSAVPESASKENTTPAVVGEKPLKEVTELASSTSPRKVNKGGGTSTLNARLDGKGINRAEGATGNAVFDSRPAPILNSSSLKHTELASLPTTAVAVRTSAVPLQVVLRDETGAVRVVPMRSVSFGSQELVRQGRNTVPVSYTDKEGVW